MSLGVGPLDGCADRTQDLNVVHKTIPSTTRGDPSLSPVLLGNRRHPTHAAINFAEKTGNNSVHRSARQLALLGRNEVLG